MIFQEGDGNDDDDNCTAAPPSSSWSGGSWQLQATNGAPGRWCPSCHPLTLSASVASTHCMEKKRNGASGAKEEEEEDEDVEENKEVEEEGAEAAGAGEGEGGDEEN